MCGQPIVDACNIVSACGSVIERILENCAEHHLIGYTYPIIGCSAVGTAAALSCGYGGSIGYVYRLSSLRKLRLWVICEWLWTHKVCGATELAAINKKTSISVKLIGITYVSTRPAVEPLI